jgi:hypothetical protein
MIKYLHYKSLAIIYKLFAVIMFENVSEIDLFTTVALIN